MNSVTKRMVVKILKDAAYKIENDTCGLDDEELLDLANKLTHVKLNIEKTCKHLNCSRAKLYIMVNNGEIPKPRKEAGGKEYWYQDEIDEYIANNSKH